ncbi:MAG: hypothetical protein Q9157_006380 [Trypethelium eluteriae]
MGHEYFYLDIIPGYHIKVNESVIHGLIRRDPGVEWVEHTTFASPPKLPTMDHDGSLSSSERSKRWQAVMEETATLELAQQSTNRTISRRDDGAREYWHWSEAGSNVDIYILDWGVDINHREFGGRAYNFNGFNASPYLEPPENAMGDTSVWGHGNCIASLAAGTLFGTGKRANIINVKVINHEVRIQWHRIIQALDDVRKAHKAKKRNRRSPFAGSIVVLSLGSNIELGGRPLRSAIKKVRRSGIPIVVAAGNDHADAAQIFPCNFPESICVSSVNHRYQRTEWSNFGKPITVAAPGLRVPCAGLRGGYTVLSGTSFSAGYVAGTISNFMSYEKLRSNVNLVMRRMKDNWNVGLLISDFPPDLETANTFNSNGFMKPNKLPTQPYVGAPLERRVRRQLWELGADANDSLRLQGTTTATLPSITPTIPPGGSLVNFTKP